MTARGLLTIIADDPALMTLACDAIERENAERLKIGMEPASSEDAVRIAFLAVAYRLKDYFLVP